MESEEHWRGWNDARERIESGLARSSSRVHRLNTLKDMESFMLGAEPNFFLLAEFVYVHCKMYKRNRWGYARVAADIRDILKEHDIGPSINQSFFKESSILSAAEIVKVYDAIENRHAAIAYLIAATTPVEIQDLFQLKISDFDEESGVICDKYKVSTFLAGKLSEYLERNRAGGAKDSDYLIANSTSLNGVKYDVSAYSLYMPGRRYYRAIARSEMETGIDPMPHLKAIRQSVRYPRDSIVRYCLRPGSRKGDGLEWNLSWKLQNLTTS